MTVQSRAYGSGLHLGILLWLAINAATLWIKLGRFTQHPPPALPLFGTTLVEGLPGEKGIACCGCGESYCHRTLLDSKGTYIGTTET